MIFTELFLVSNCFQFWGPIVSYLRSVLTLLLRLLLPQHGSQTLVDEEEGKRGEIRDGIGESRGRDERRRRAEAATGTSSSSNSSLEGPSSLTKENIYDREEGQKWVEMSGEDVRVLRRNLLSSLQQCEEALNKCIVEVS